MGITYITVSPCHYLRIPDVIILDHYHRYYLNPQHPQIFPSPSSLPSSISHSSIIFLFLVHIISKLLSWSTVATIVEAYSVPGPIYHSCPASSTLPWFILISRPNPYGCSRFPVVTLGHYLSRLPYDLRLLGRRRSSL